MHYTCTGKWVIEKRASWGRAKKIAANWEESKHSLELLVASRRVSLIPFAELHLAALGWLWLKKRWTGVHTSCIDSRSTQHRTQNRRPLSVPSKFKGHWKNMDQMDHNIMHGSCSSLPYSLPTFPFISYKLAADLWEQNLVWQQSCFIPSHGKKKVVIMEPAAIQDWRNWQQYVENHELWRNLRFFNSFANHVFRIDLQRVIAQLSLSNCLSCTLPEWLTWEL